MFRIDPTRSINIKQPIYQTSLYFVGHGNRCLDVLLFHHVGIIGVEGILVLVKYKIYSCNKIEAFYCKFKIIQFIIQFTSNEPNTKHIKYQNSDDQHK